MLHTAVRSVASVHVRNMATLGGNLALPTRCWYTNQTETWRNARAGCFKTDVEQCHVLASSHRCVATSSADTVPALIALNGSITAASPAIVDQHSGQTVWPVKKGGFPSPE